MKKAVAGLIIFALLFSLSGCESQYDKGYKDGYDEGRNEGYIGSDDAFSDGYDTGYDWGRSEAFEEAKENAKDAVDEMVCEFGNKCAEYEGLTPAEALLVLDDAADGVSVSDEEIVQAVNSLYRFYCFFLDGEHIAYMDDCELFD